MNQNFKKKVVKINLERLLPNARHKDYKLIEQVKLIKVLVQLKSLINKMEKKLLDLKRKVKKDTFK